MEVGYDIFTNHSPLSWSCRLQSRLPDFVGSLRSALTEASIPTNWATEVGLGLGKKCPFSVRRHVSFLLGGDILKLQQGRTFLYCVDIFDYEGASRALKPSRTKTKPFSRILELSMRLLPACREPPEPSHLTGGSCNWAQRMS